MRSVLLSSEELRGIVLLAHGYTWYMAKPMAPRNRIMIAITTKKSIQLRGSSSSFTHLPHTWTPIFLARPFQPRLAYLSAMLCLRSFHWKNSFMSSLSKP